MTYIEINCIFGIIEFMYILYMKKTVLIKKEVLIKYEDRKTLEYTRYYRQHMTLGNAIITLCYCLTPFINVLNLVYINTFWVFRLIESKDLVLNPKSCVYKIYVFYKGHCGCVQKIGEYIRKFFNIKIF